MKKRILLLCAGIVAIGVVAVLLYIVTRPQPPSTEYQVRSVVYGFGDELSQVSLVGKPEVIAKEMDQHYALYIHPDLLEGWKKAPETAPGRRATAPVPDRIEVQTLTLNENGTYTAEALIITATSPSGDSSVRLTLTRGPDGWQITRYERVSES